MAGQEKKNQGQEDDGDEDFEGDEAEWHVI